MMIGSRFRGQLVVSHRRWNEKILIFFRKNVEMFLKIMINIFTKNGCATILKECWIQRIL
jgi:hypothetical protein